MNSNASSRVEMLLAPLTERDIPALFGSGRRLGLEKEALRVSTHAELAQTPHPAGLGAALTHPYITTDYSEALLELVTPPLADAPAALAFLENLHTYTYLRLAHGEVLWADSMPCVMKNSQDIPVARYGDSNIGRMKTIYRIGLGCRYGRAMQTIAGVHFNYSFNPDLWPHLGELTGTALPGRQLQSHFYMHAARNLLRFGWMIPYLFGASPAICRTFVDIPRNLKPFDSASLYEPYATSLRMGDIGYQNNQEVKFGVTPAFNTLSEYIQSLRRAISTPCPAYEKIGIIADGEYRQLNANMLQLENENYMSVRLKNISTDKEEMPLRSLHRGGVRYIELRSLDLNPFHPAGIALQQLDFLETLTVFCVLEDSPLLTEDEYRRIRHNEILVAHQGRRPGLKLRCGDGERPLRELGTNLCERMQAVAELLDQADGGDRRQALDAQQNRFKDPDTTPSARVLAEMRDNGESFAAFAWRRSQAFRKHYLQQSLNTAQVAQWDRLAQDSLTEQKRLEDGDSLPLDRYIRRYFAQLEALDGPPAQGAAR